MLHVGTLQPSLTSQGEWFIVLLFLPAWQQPHHSKPYLTRTGKSLHSLAALHTHVSVPTDLPSRPCSALVPMVKFQVQVLALKRKALMDLKNVQ